MKATKRLMQIISSYTHRAEHEAALDAILQEGKTWADMADVSDEELDTFLYKVTAIPKRIARKRANQYFMNGQFDLLRQLRDIYQYAHPSRREVLKSYDHYSMTGNTQRAKELYRATGIMPLKIVKRVIRETYPVKVEVIGKYVYPTPGQDPILYAEQDLPCFNLTVIRPVSQDDFQRMREGHRFRLTLPRCYEYQNVLGQTIGFLEPDSLAWENSKLKLIIMPRDKPVRIDM